MKRKNPHEYGDWTPSDDLWIVEIRGLLLNPINNTLDRAWLLVDKFRTLDEAVECWAKVEPIYNGKKQGRIIQYSTNSIIPCDIIQT